MAFRIGLVVEGQSDFVVVKQLLTAYFRSSRPDKELFFVELQPSNDGIAGSSDGGGWEAVYQWCNRNGPDQRRNYFLGSGLFAAGLSSKLCDIIIVQVDADVCELFAERTGAAASAFPLVGPEIRGSYTREVLLSWLWPDGLVAEGDHLAAPTVEMIEAWLVAGLGEHPHAESYQNPMTELMRHDYASRGRPLPAGAKRIRKQRHRYEKLAANAAIRVEAIVASCSWFKRLVDSIEPLLVDQ